MYADEFIHNSTKLNMTYVIHFGSMAKCCDFIELIDAQVRATFDDYFYGKVE